jgi:type IV pilus assembly protein PilE
LTSDMKPYLRLHKQPGFTLIEVMITVALIGMLAAIALPSFQEYVARSRRLDAQATLLEAAQFMERYYTQNGTYTGATLPTALQVSPSGSSGGKVFYDITFQKDSLTATKYSLQAAPANTQKNDRCGVLTFTEAGVRGVSKLTVAECWRR